MRIAWVSPLPPASSGIADYSAELLPHLAEHCELELFYEGSATVDPALAGRFRCRPVSALAGSAAGEAFDLTVYQLGNSPPHHAESYRLALARPGVVVLHEFMLHHLVRGLTLARGDAAGYLEEMRYAAGASGWRAARRLLDTHFPVDPWSYPLFERLVDRAQGVLVHNEFARSRVLASRPMARVEVVPMPSELDAAPPTPAERADLKRQLGVEPDGFLVASFGFVTPQKRLEPPLAAFARLRREVPRARFAVVGEVSPHYDFAEALSRLGGDGVQVVGRCPLARFHAWMRACDVAVNLRHPTGGETSASFLRLLGLGRPVVVNPVGAFAEVPEGACLQTPIDGFEEATLLAYFRRLAAEPRLGEAIGRSARRFAEQHHAPKLAAAAYLERLAAWAREPRDPEPVAPPLAPYDPHDPWPALIARLGGELADLGLGESDPEALAALGEMLVDLELDRPR